MSGCKGNAKVQLVGSQVRHLILRFSTAYGVRTLLVSASLDCRMELSLHIEGVCLRNHVP